jgi:hypothetical protein
MSDESSYLIPMPFDAEKAILARKRKIAMDLINTQPVQTGMYGGMGAGIGAALSRAAGTMENARLDDQQRLLSSNEARQRREFLQRNGIDPDTPNDLRASIEWQLKQPERAKQADAENIARREDLAIRLGSEAEMKREHDAAALALKKQPSIQEYRSVGGSSGGGSSGKPDADLDRQIKQQRLENMKNPKPIASERKAALAQDELVGKVDNALAELEKNPDAVGLKTFIPNVALQRYDPSGVQARSFISELGAEKAHDLYGASFTAAERARADKFIPADGDDNATVIKKLQGMKKLAEQARARAMGKAPTADPTSSGPPVAPARKRFNPATGRVEP